MLLPYWLKPRESLLKQVLVALRYGSEMPAKISNVVLLDSHLAPFWNKIVGQNIPTTLPHNVCYDMISPRMLARCLAAQICQGQESQRNRAGHEQHFFNSNKTCDFKT